MRADAPAADPFGERLVGAYERRVHVLGAEFRFNTASRALLALVDSAYRGLPRHRLGGRTPQIHVSLALTEDDRDARWTEPPRLRTLGNGSLLAGTIDRSNYAVLSPSSRSGLVAVSRRMLEYRYHARYELLEFAVFMLAARVQNLVPLHVACVAHDGRGALLVGDSGAGKSTLALQCLLAGLEFVSEDSAFVCPKRLSVTGVANFVHVRPDTLRYVDAPWAKALLRRSPTIRRRSGIAKLEVDLRDGPWPLARAPCRTSAIVFLTHRPVGKGPALRSLGLREARRRLKRAQPYAVGQPGWSMFERRLKTLPLWELRRGSHPRDGVAAISALLGA